MKRKYELKKRAERLAETRRRITEATVELHRTVGPAATHINEVALRAILEGGLLRYLDQARRVLTEPIDVRGHRRERVDAAARAAIDLHTWRALAPLGDTEAADLAAGLVELAADTGSTR